MRGSLLNNEIDGQAVTLSSTDAMSGANYGAQKAAWLFNTYASIVRGATGTAWEPACSWRSGVLYDDGLSLVSGDKFRVTAASSQAWMPAAATWLPWPEQGLVCRPLARRCSTRVSGTARIRSS